MFASLKTAQRGFSRWLPWAVVAFLLLVGLAGYLGAVLGSLPAWLVRALEYISNFSAVFLGIFVEAAPFLLLGTVASGIVDVFIDREDLARWIPRRPLAGALAGSLLGLAFPVCECGVVPFTRKLIHKGLPLPAAVATLLAAPVLNPVVIASTLAAFGPSPVLWGRIGLSLLIATLTGLIFSLQPEAARLLRDAPAQPVHVEVPAQPEPPARAAFSKKVRRVFLVAADEFFEMGRYLVLGALLAALMQTLVRQSALVAVGQGPVLSVLVMLALAVILSVCSTVDAFIALAFAGTFSTGALLAFLVYGPMVDIKSTLMFLRVFKPRAVAYLVLLPLLMTLVLTVAANYLAPRWGF